MFEGLYHLSLTTIYHNEALNETFIESSLLFKDLILCTHQLYVCEFSDADALVILLTIHFKRSIFLSLLVWLHKLRVSLPTCRDLSPSILTKLGIGIPSTSLKMLFHEITIR